MFKRRCDGAWLIKKDKTELKRQGINISEPGIWKWLNAAAIPDASNILALSRWLAVRAEWLEYGRGHMRDDGAIVMARNIKKESYTVEVFDLADSAGPGVMIRDEFIDTITIN